MTLVDAVQQYALSEEFKGQVEALKNDMRTYYENISFTRTPEVSGSGLEVVKTRPDGYKYLEETYLRNRLDYYFPGWSWEMAAPLHFLGAEWVGAQGHLIIIDPYLLAFGIKPPVRKFYGVDYFRVQYKQGEAHTPENIIDIGNSAASANSGAFKIAVNRLTHIGDDIFKKQFHFEGSGTYEDLAIYTGSKTHFSNWIDRKHISWEWVFMTLGVESVSEIKDIPRAIQTIKETKGWN